MAEVNPPAWLQAGTYPAQTDRLSVLSLLASYSGAVADEATPMRVRQGVKPSWKGQQLKVRATETASMKVVVSAGFALVDNRESSGYGAYGCANDSDVTLDIAAADAAKYRLDTVVASVHDAESSGADSEWRLDVVSGALADTEDGTERGTLPPSSLPLADIVVSPGASSIAASDIWDARQYTVACGGALPTDANEAPEHLAVGQLVYLHDDDRWVYGTASGETRRLLPDTGWVNLHMPVGYKQFSNNAPYFQIRRVGTRVTMRGRLQYVNNTMPTGEQTFPLYDPLDRQFRPTHGGPDSYVEVVATTNVTAACPSGTMRAQVMGDGWIKTELHSSMTDQGWIGFGDAFSWYVD